MSRSPLSPAVAVFGARVRAIRVQKGWSLEALGHRSGLHWTYVGSVERGQRNISLVNILRLAAALETDAGELLREL